MIVASIDIRRALAEASVSGLPGLLFGADVGNRPPGDAVEARGGLLVSLRRGYFYRPRGLLRHKARPRAAKMNHLQLGGCCFLVALAAPFKLDGKTSSMEAPACTVPAAHGMDTASNERARSEKLRSMFSV